MEKTFRDLKDVYRHLNDDNLSDTESGYRERIIMLCRDIAEENPEEEEE